VSQAEDKLSEVPGDNRGAIVSTDSAEAAAVDENAGQIGPGENGANEPGTPPEAEDLTDADIEDAEDAEDAEDEGDEEEDDGDVDSDGDVPVTQSDDEPSVSLADLEQEGEIAADYVEGLLDIADLDGDIDMDVEGNRALVSVVGATLDELVGRRGEVLEALQELTRLAVHRQTGERARLMLDVGGYRARRRAELTEVGRHAAEEVRQTGTPKELASMTPFERKIVHGAVADAGLRSESEGEEPNRRVVVYPAE
jgi:spoIIIJ-associated protein